MLVKLSDIFYTFNGYASSNIKNIDLDKKGNNYIPYKRPSNNILNTVAGYVSLDDVPSKYIFENAIMVSTDGEGSHTFSYFIKYQFVPNSNVMVLKPKVRLTDIEMIIYSRIITHNRYKFQYGRKPKGSRITEVLIPDRLDVAAIISNLHFDENLIYGKMETMKKEIVTLPNIREWEYFKYSELFSILKGKRLTKENSNYGNTVYLSSKDNNNNFDRLIDLDPIYHKNTLTVNSNGSVGSAFYHEYEYWASDNTNVLVPKFHLNKYIGLFLTTIIEKEKYRFGYGRLWNTSRMNNTILKLPVTELGEPDWNLMELYMKSLPYSEYI